MRHIMQITKQHPASAETLLQWQQKAAVFGGLATGLSTLANALNAYTQADERKSPDA